MTRTYSIEASSRLLEFLAIFITALVVMPQSWPYLQELTPGFSKQARGLILVPWTLFWAWAVTKLVAVRRYEVHMDEDGLIIYLRYPWGKTAQAFQLTRDNIRAAHLSSPQSGNLLVLDTHYGASLRLHNGYLTCRSKGFTEWLEDLRSWLEPIPLHHKWWH